MINSKRGSTAIINIISIIINLIIIIAVGVIYYIFLSPEKLELKQIEYTKIDTSEFEIDKEFEEGLDTIIDFNYTKNELDMHRDLKDYYQGRENPFSPSEERNTLISIPESAPVEDETGGQDTDESEIDLDGSVSQNNSSILNF